MTGRDAALYRERMELNVTASAILDGRLVWNGYVVRCPECGAAERLSLRSGTQPGQDLDDAEWAEARCPAGHDFTHPLIYPALVHFLAERTEKSPLEVPDWYPRVRGRRSYALEDTHEQWLNWDQADYISQEYLHGYWQRHWPELAAAAYADPGVRQPGAVLPHTIRTTLEQNPGPDPAARWEVWLVERPEPVRTDIVTGPDPATAVLQQVYRLLHAVAEYQNIDKVTVESSDRHQGWPWVVTVTTVHPFPGIRKDGGWVCARHINGFYVRQVDAQGHPIGTSAQAREGRG